MMRLPHGRRNNPLKDRCMAALAGAGHRMPGDFSCGQFNLACDETMQVELQGEAP
jgi:hypothetical protein